jgi:hypothetical protein
MVATRLSRPNQTWALALNSAFANPAAPTLAELNDRRFVHLVSCALTEDGTELTMGDSETDNTLVFCSIGTETTPTFANITASLQWLMDRNTGGAGSTVDLASLYNKVTAMLGSPDIEYWLISRTGPNASQDTDFASGHVIKMAHISTDQPQYVLEQNTPVRGLQNPSFTGEYNWNYLIP